VNWDQQDWQSCSLAPFGFWVLAEYFPKRNGLQPLIIGFPIRAILWVSRGTCILFSRLLLLGFSFCECGWYLRRLLPVPSLVLASFSPFVWDYQVST
jgi:hypothetical protein